MELNEQLKIDDESRDRIVKETGISFFVEAGAGSGKTTMLVRRMVALVEQGMDISKICAITFTRAAAGEFYDRFQRLLIERSNPDYVWKDTGRFGELPAPTEETRARCAEALENIDLCFMGTIDSFCNMLLSEHPREAGIPSDAKMMTDADLEALLRREYVSFCEGSYGPELQEMAAAFRSVHRHPDEVFVAGMKRLMGLRNAEFHTVDNDCNVDEIFKEERLELIEIINKLLKHPEVKEVKNAKSADAWEHLAAAAIPIRKKWSMNYAAVQSALKSIQELRLCVRPQELNLVEGKMLQIHDTRGKFGWTETNIKALLERYGSVQYTVSMQFLTACMALLEEDLRHKGSMTYFDYLYYLRNMLQDDAANGGKLIRYISSRHSVFLIDEFQDTNPMQAEIFFYLTAQNPTRRWDKCVPRPGSLFIVGDPKQSIYRFRSADVTSFLRVKHLFENGVGEILKLPCNFRSTVDMCKYFNRTFAALLPEETEDQSAFETIPMPKRESTDEFGGVYSYQSYYGSATENHADGTDPIQVSRMIQTLVNNPQLQICGADEKGLRPIRYSDIMVITGTKKTIADYILEFRNQSIPARVEGKVAFESCPSLRAIIELLAAVADTDDAVALYGALNGSIFNFTESQLMNYRAKKLPGGKPLLLRRPKAMADGQPSDQTDSDDMKAITAAISALCDTADEARSLTPAALFTRVLEKYNVLSVTGTESLEVLLYTLELIRAGEKDGSILTHSDCVDFLHTRLDGQADEERCLSLQENPDCVHIANLHKVKGLEAPVVILAKNTTRAQTPDLRIEHNPEGTEGWLFSLGQDGSFYNYFSTASFSDEMAREKESMAAERARLVYVAATRARNALIICDSIGQTKGKETHTTAWKPLMNQGEVDFFEHVPENSSALTPAKAEADAAALTAKAEAESVLQPIVPTVKTVIVKAQDNVMRTAQEVLVRPAEIASWQTVTPSKVKTPGKFDVEDHAEAATEELEPESNDEHNIVSQNGLKIEESPDILNIAKAESDQSGNAHSYPTLLGTAAHRLMEVLVSSHNRADADSTVKQILEEFASNRSREDRDCLQGALTLVAKRMRSGGYSQENGVPSDILKELLSADEVFCEVPFCYSGKTETGETALCKGTMDVIYLKGNAWHIVDYKTNADGTDLDRHYAGQLAEYRKAFQTLTGFTADAHIYHIDI